MKQFQAKFIEDANELLADLEKVVLELEDEPENRQLLEEVYRVMHTLKGVSSMFGFEKIGEFTHHLESLYDYILEGKLKINKKIMNLTFLSVDLLKTMLEDANLSNPDDLSTFNNLTKRIVEIADQVYAEGSEEETSEKEEDKQPDEKSNIKTYYILLKPEEDVFKRGVNLLSIFGELYDLGQCLIFAYTHNIPTLHEMEAIECYTYWEIYLSTDQPFEAIEDVFIFVPDECKINKLFQANLLEDENFLKKVDEMARLQESIDFIELKKFVNELKAGEQGDVAGLVDESDEDEDVDAIQEQDKTVKEVQKQTKTPEKKQKSTLANFTEHKTSSIRVASDKLDELMNLVSELVTTKAELHVLSKAHKVPQLGSIAEKVDKLSRQFRDNALSIRLVPIGHMLVSFKRLVRDLSFEFGKDIDFITEGTETELDKTIIDNLSNPLMHILRNSIDHGIENADVREAKGKPTKGTIKLKAYYSGTNVAIEITDDGAGLNHEKIRSKAIEKGLISPDTVLTQKEIIELIFAPGFSTAQAVSEVSGRGIGMDVVKQRIADIRGDVDIESQPDKGTKIIIKLPLTLSIVDALLVKIDTISFLIPLSVVDNCNEATHEKIEKASNNRIILDGEMIPYIYLREEFKIHENRPEVERIVVINYEGRKIGLVVDAVIGEHQAVLKPLGEIFRNQNSISGGSILGDGSVALVIDTNKLISKYISKRKELDINHETQA